MKKTIITKIGGFFPMDNEGFVVNPTSKVKIKHQWSPIITAVIAEYRKAYKDKLHSVYLRGSVAQGLDTGPINDLDIFGLIYNKKGGYVSWKNVSWNNQLQKKLFEKYQLQNQIDLGYSTYTLNVGDMNLKIQMLLKTQSLCVWGQDVIPEIRNFKPGKEMILNLQWIESDLNETIEKLQTTENTDDIKELCTSIMKIIIRAGFELVIEKEARFTNHLYQCYETFSAYYPEKNQAMYTALDLFVNPTENKTTIIQTIQELGFWIVKKAVSKV